MVHELEALADSLEAIARCHNWHENHSKDMKCRLTKEDTKILMRKAWEIKQIARKGTFSEGI